MASAVRFVVRVFIVSSTLRTAAPGDGTRRAPDFLRAKGRASVTDGRLEQLSANCRGYRRTVSTGRQAAPTEKHAGGP